MKTRFAAKKSKPARPQIDALYGAPSLHNIGQSSANALAQGCCIAASSTNALAQGCERQQSKA